MTRNTSHNGTSVARLQRHFSPGTFGCQVLFFILFNTW